MVVLFVLALLLVALFTASGSVLDDTKIKETRSVMSTLDMAVEQFKNDAPMRRVRAYRGRYGDFPCDELEGFIRSGTNPGLPDWTNPGTGAVIGPGRDSDLNMPSNGLNGIEHQDIKAMVLAIRLYSPEASSILDQVPNRFKRAPTNADEFFDRNDNGDLDMDDEPLAYFIDSWGTPLDYFSIGIEGEDCPDDAREVASAFFVKTNGNRPLFVSYGPDGEFQSGLTSGGGVNVVNDYFDDSNNENKINHVNNDDNVYLDETIRQRLREGHKDDAT